MVTRQAEQDKGKAWSVPPISEMQGESGKEPWVRQKSLRRVRLLSQRTPELTPLQISELSQARTGCHPGPGSIITGWEINLAAKQMAEDIFKDLSIIGVRAWMIIEALESQANAKADAKISLKTAAEASMPEVSSSKTIAKMVKDQVAAALVSVKPKKGKAAKRVARPYVPLPAKAARAKARRAGKAVAGRKKKTKASSSKALKGKGRT
ncbi:hypothetical protein C0993_000779 [Termitomyces sp. T159_Od127]|nr:hypothetical protein C0993_000779 [Termitomyces sp. T159_Od127]